METLVHELGHHWQQMLGEDPFVPNSQVTHNKEFRAKMIELGIYCDSEGAYYKVVPEDSPAGILFKEWAMSMPDGVPVGKAMNFDWIKWFAKEQGKERKGRSTLRKFSYECGQNIRVSQRDWPGATCKDCLTDYMPAEPRPRK